MANENQPPKPARLNGGTMLVALDALLGTMNIVSDGTFHYSRETRIQAANDIIGIIGGTSYTVVKVDGET